MSKIYEYKGFIPQNIAPKGAKNITFFNGNGEKVYTCALGKMTHPTGTKLYSFGLISDTHIQSSAVYSDRLNAAMEWFNQQGVALVCHAGDITNHGFYNSDGTTDLTQFAEYKRICELYPDVPIYALCGNHDSYFTPITNNLTALETYTGKGLYYYVEYNNDIFAFIGQPANTVAMNETEISWLEDLLEANTAKRCFVFIHPYISDDSGNSNNVYGNALLPTTSAITTRLKTALTNHGGAVLFHGHTHFKPHLQETDETTTYTEKNGFPSVHIPSLAVPADVVDGERVQSTTESYGYIADVYNSCIVLRGRDFVNNQWLPIATLKISY